MFQYSQHVLLLLITILSSFWLAYAIWSRRPGAGVIPFIALSLGVAIWASGDALHFIAVPLNIKIISLHISYLGITLAPAAWFVFVLEYIGKERWVTKKLLAALALEPLLLQIILLTNPLHEGFLANLGLTQANGLSLLDYSYGNLFWVHAIYNYILLVISAVFLVRALIRSPHLYRGQLIWLMVSILSPWIANFIYLFGFSPLPDYVDITPIAFNISVVATAWGLYRFRLMDLVPVARDVIIENMEDGILVLDALNRVVDANKSILRLLDKSSAEVIGESIFELLAKQEDLVEQFRDKEQGNAEISLDVGDEARIFRVRMSSIYNRQQVATGRIVLIHDITTLKEANRALQDANEKVLETTRLKSQFLQLCRMNSAHRLMRLSATRNYN